MKYSSDVAAIEPDATVSLVIDYEFLKQLPNLINREEESDCALKGDDDSDVEWVVD